MGTKDARGVVVPQAGDLEAWSALRRLVTRLARVVLPVQDCHGHGHDHDHDMNE